MSRSGYTDDYEHMNIYRATVERTIKGKKGQMFLKELAATMDAMPDKKLISHELIAETGEMCTIGTVCKARGISVAGIDIEDPETVGKLVGISRTLAAEIEYENDEGGHSRETPEERWTRMRSWINSNIIS